MERVECINVDIDGWCEHQEGCCDFEISHLSIIQWSN